MFANYSEGEREALATMRRMLHGLNQATSNLDYLADDNQDYHKLSELAERVTKYTEVVRSRELHTFKGACQIHRQAQKLQLTAADGTRASKS